MCNCPTPHDLFCSIDDAIDGGGWFMTGVTVGPPGQLKWLYTVGLAERFAHPELLVVGICCAPCGAGILGAVTEQVAAGEHPLAPTAEPLELEGGRLHLRPVPPACWESSWFAIWKAYYEGKPYEPPPASAIQVVYPDRAGRFPWEPGCDPLLAACQQLPEEPPAPPPLTKRTPRRGRGTRPTRPRSWS